jgi:hypothetical protein
MLPCRKNLTYHNYQLYAREDRSNPVMVSKGHILALNPFNIRTFLQKNDKVYFEVDREIEFEVLSKSFAL